MIANVVIRRARSSDADEIARLIAVFAAEALMLRRTPEMVELAIDDYVVAVDPTGKIVACGALKEYSPSVAEIAAIAVSREAHGGGVGRAIVGAVETLAMKRGIHDVFALTLQPAFFAAIGYQRVDRARYPEEDPARLPLVFAPLCVQRDLFRQKAAPGHAGVEVAGSQTGASPRGFDVEAGRVNSGSVDHYRSVSHCRNATKRVADAVGGSFCFGGPDSDVRH